LLFAVAAAAGEVVGTLKDLEGHRGDVSARDVMIVADRQRRIDDGLPVDQRAVRLEIRLLDCGQRAVARAHVDALAEQLLEPVRTIETRARTGDSQSRSL